MSSSQKLYIHIVKPPSPEESTILKNATLSDITDAYKFVLAKQMEENATKGMLRKFENEYTEEKINKVRADVKKLMSTTKNIISLKWNVRAVINALKIYDRKYQKTTKE